MMATNYVAHPAMKGISYFFFFFLVLIPFSMASKMKRALSSGASAKLRMMPKVTAVRSRVVEGYSMTPDFRLCFSQAENFC